MSDERPEVPQPPLNGWKEIAAYLGKSVRSVQRWEGTLGLPVHRLRTPDGQIVYGDRDEIDAWRRSLDHPPTPEPEDPLDPDSLPEQPPEPVAPAFDPPRVPLRRGLLAAAGALLFMAGLAAGAWLSRPSPVATAIAFAGQHIQGLNEDGVVVWAYEFDGDVTRAPGPRPTSVDIEGDGRTEWLVGVRFNTKAGQPQASDGLYCFTQTGELKWALRPDQNLTYPDRTMSAPWVMADVAVAAGTPRRVWAAFAHHTGGSSFVLEIDGAGRSTLRYVQFGRIYAVAHWMTPSGGFLAAGGASSEHRRATLALMPDTDPPASYPIDDPTRSSCRECPPAVPRRVYLFPDSELTVASHVLHPHVANITTVGPTLKVAALQGEGRSQLFLGPDFSITAFDFTQDYWGAHRDLERKGRLDHPAEACPDRTATMVIHGWTREHGWQRWGILPGGKSGPARRLDDDEDGL